MDYTKYENHEQLAELDRQIKAIHPKMRFNSVGIVGNRVVSVSVLLAEKGNKPLIEKLMAMGFENKRREKIKTYDLYHPRDISYRMQVRLTKYLR